MNPTGTPSPDRQPSPGGVEPPPQPHPEPAPTALPHYSRLHLINGISPATIRAREFPTVRRGADPAEVHAFLDTVADEVAALHRELIIAHQENDRLKRALRDWQTAHAARRSRPRQPDPRRQPRPGWPTNPG